MSFDRARVAGSVYEGVWGETFAYLQQLLANGEREPARLLSLLAGDGAVDPAMAELLGKVGCRFAGRLVQPYKPDSGLQQPLFEMLKRRILRQWLPSGTQTVVELGSGYGRNLFELWMSGLPQSVHFCGLELTAAGRACAEELARHCRGLDYESAPFDFYSPDFSMLEGRKNIFVFTCYSIEQITQLPSSTLAQLAALSGLTRVVHIEPVGWQYGEEEAGSIEELDIRRQMSVSATRKGYNRNLVAAVAALEEQGVIEIEQELPDMLAHRPDLPGSVIVWRPARPSAISR